jgi:hypothetical protein
MKLTPITKSKKKITYSSKNKTVRALRSDLKKIQEIQNNIDKRKTELERVYKEALLK